MRHTRIGCSLAILLLCPVLITFSSAQVKSELVKGRKAARGEVLVKFRQLAPNVLAAVAQGYDLTSTRPLGGVPRLYHLRSRSRDANALAQVLSARPDVLYAEPNFEVRALDSPNDPQYAQQWALKNVGQSSDSFAAGTPGADISAEGAWDVSTGNTAQVVGIVDTGIDYTHPDLQSNIWSAPAGFTVTVGGFPITCAAGTHGFNAILLTCDPMDDFMHGTHVSGIIGAIGNNNVGVVGVNWTTQMMGLKFLNSQGSGYTSDAINAIEFAIQAKALFAPSNGANVRILTNSWGGSGFSQALEDEIDRAASNDMLFVAAAGNSSVSIDTLPMYPASYNRPNMISVAATDNNDALASFSNYSVNSVHLGAPGVDVLSTLLGGTYGYLSGTSMATPHVTGAAALMLSVCTLNTSSLKKNLLDNVDAIPALAGTTTTGGRLNVNHAVRSCNGPVGLSPVALTYGTVLAGKNSTARVVTLTNYQTAVLNLSSVVTSGDFSQTNNCGTSLAPSAGCTITVTFNPTSSGNETGQLQVFDDAPSSPQSASLSGTGMIAPDLIASAATSVTLTSPGSPITVTSTVLNQGSADAGATIAGIYVSLTATKDKSATLAGSFNVPLLPAAKSFSTTATVTIPASLKPGTYYVLVCADDSNIVVEPDETNNCGASATPLQLQLPDLAESAVSFGAPSNATLQITDTATDLGTVGAPASVTQYYLSAGNWKSTSSRLLTGSRSIPSLAAGANSAGSATVTVPSDVTAGKYYVLACADDANLVPESNETNNCAASSTQLAVGPDLIEGAVSSPSAFSGAGATLQANDTTTNQGAWAAGASFTQYYLSPYNSRTSASRVLSGARSISALAAGANSAGTASVTVPSDMAVGSYYLLACADDTLIIAEANETNNCAASSTKLQVGPDLIETAVSTTATLIGPSSTLLVSDTAANQGGGNAAASLTQYYLSPYNSKTGASRLLSGSRSVPALGVSATSAGNMAVTVPSDMAVGSYYLLACADDTGIVPETNETNNCVAFATKLQVGPDLVDAAVSTSSIVIGPNSLFNISDTVVNQGGGPAAVSLTQYYLSPYNSKTGASRLLSGSRSIPSLLAGANSVGTATATVPSDMAIGSYYLLACADDTSVVAETNETNNCAAFATKLQVGPDLIESGVSANLPSVVPGAPLQVSDTVLNQGGGSAAASLTQYYLSPYNSKTGASRLLGGSRSIPGLAPVTTSAGVAIVTVPSDVAAGSYYVLACADDTSLVAETSETNNCAAATAKVQVTAH